MEQVQMTPSFLAHLLVLDGYRPINDERSNWWRTPEGHPMTQGMVTLALQHSIGAENVPACIPPAVLQVGRYLSEIETSQAKIARIDASMAHQWRSDRQHPMLKEC